MLFRIERSSTFSIPSRPIGRVGNTDFRARCPSQKKVERENLDARRGALGARRGIERERRIGRIDLSELDSRGENRQIER